MEKENDLIDKLSLSVQVGKLFTAQLIQLSEDSQFRKKLLVDLEGYEEFYSRIIAIKPKDEDLDSLSDFQKLRNKAMAKMSTITDKSPKKMCDMIIKGLERGIEELTHALDTEKGEEPRALSLTNEYRRFLMDKMEEYKNYP
ncbi:MAG: hypothetical protein RR198_02735 [Oscillospiraceae bacterium]